MGASETRPYNAPLQNAHLSLLPAWRLLHRLTAVRIDIGAVIFRTYLRYPAPVARDIFSLIILSNL